MTSIILTFNGGNSSFYTDLSRGEFVPLWWGIRPYIPSESIIGQGIQQTVKHFKALFISEKPIFLSKILMFNLIIEYQIQHMDSDIFYPSSIGGWTRYMLTSSHLRSKVLVLCRVVHRYRHGVYRCLERKW